MNLLDEYKQKVAPKGSTLYYSLLFAPADKRDALIAIYALQQELQQTTDHYRELSVAKAKLIWWQQEIQRMFQGHAQHPLAQFLQEAIKQYNMPQALFAEWLDAALLKLDTDHLCNEKDLILWGYREFGICALLGAYILGFSEHKSLTGLHDIATAAAIIYLIQNMRSYLQQGKCYIPLDILAKYNIDENQLNSQAMSPALRNCLNDLWQLAQSLFKQGKSKVQKADQASLAPLIIQNQLAIYLGEEIAKDKFEVLSHKIALTPLRKLWLAWKSYRSLK